MEDNRVVVFFTTDEKIKDIFLDEDFIIEFDEQTVVAYKVTDCQNSNVYIIHDNFSNDLDEIIKDRIGYFVYHNETEDELKLGMERLGFQGYRDHNVPLTSKIAQGYYAWLFDVGEKTLRGDVVSKDQFEALWELFQVSSDIKESLDILHSIFSGTPITLDFIKRYRERLNTISKKDIANTTKNFIHDVQQENYKYDDTQQHSLSSLRDLLLSDI